MNEENQTTIKNRDYLSCLAAAFIVAGLLLLGGQGGRFPTYSPVKDLIGLGLCVIGLIFGWEWVKWNRQRYMISASDY